MGTPRSSASWYRTQSQPLLFGLGFTGHILGYPSGVSLRPRLCGGRMCLLHPQAEGGLGPSLLIVWESQGTLVSPGRAPWSSYISWDWERGGRERVGWLVTHMC